VRKELIVFFCNEYNYFYFYFAFFDGLNSEQMKYLVFGEWMCIRNAITPPRGCKNTTQIAMGDM